jgi:hypothetical protein
MMREYCQEVEERLRALNEWEKYGGWVSQWWVMIHEDGRRARMPDPYPPEVLKAVNEQSYQEWIKYEHKINNIKLDD